MVDNIDISQVLVAKGLCFAFSRDHTDPCCYSVHTIRKLPTSHHDLKTHNSRNKQPRQTSHPSLTSPQHPVPSPSLATCSPSAAAPSATTAPSILPGPKPSQPTSSKCGSAINEPSSHPASPPSKTFGSGTQTISSTGHSNMASPINCSLTSLVLR